MFSFCLSHLSCECAVLDEEENHPPITKKGFCWWQAKLLRLERGLLTHHSPQPPEKPFWLHMMFQILLAMQRQLQHAELLLFVQLQKLCALMMVRNICSLLPHHGGFKISILVLLYYVVPVILREVLANSSSTLLTLRNSEACLSVFACPSLRTCVAWQYLFACLSLKLHTPNAGSKKLKCSYQGICGFGGSTSTGSSSVKAQAAVVVVPDVPPTLRLLGPQQWDLLPITWELRVSPFTVATVAVVYFFRFSPAAKDVLLFLKAGLVPVPMEEIVPVIHVEHNQNCLLEISDARCLQLPPLCLQGYCEAGNTIQQMWQKCRLSHRVRSRSWIVWCSGWGSDISHWMLLHFQEEVCHLPEVFWISSLELTNWMILVPSNEE